MREFNILTIVVFLTLFHSCKLKETYRYKIVAERKAKIERLKVGYKNVYFIGMHHYGKQRFYDDVKNKIAKFHTQNAKVYYETMYFKHVRPEQQAAQDSLKGKVRKIMGSIAADGYYQKYAFSKIEDFTYWKNLAPQPNVKGLGINKEDVHADPDWKEVIFAFEKKFGEIQLDSNDFKPFRDSIFYSTNTTLEQYNFILLDFRNEYVARKILSSNDTNIVVLFGSNHKKGIFESLKRLESEYSKK